MQATNSPQNYNVAKAMEVFSYRSKNVVARLKDVDEQVLKIQKHVTHTETVTLGDKTYTITSPLLPEVTKMLRMYVSMFAALVSEAEKCMDEHAEDTQAVFTLHEAPEVPNE